MKKICLYLGSFFILGLVACDLQPKIVSLPDSVGDFISARYPALLADPETQPEIYNSAAIDYGVYASPNLYGAVENEDYVEYASVDDYIVPPQYEDAVLYGAEPYSENNVSIDSGEPILVTENDNVVQDYAEDEYLQVPMYGGSKTVVTESEIIVKPGDTLYSLAKQHNMTVEELARINDLKQPYNLSVGQKLKIKSEKETVTVQTITVPEKKLYTNVPVQTKTKVQLKEITVGAGDTLYSISRKYSVPVNDLAVMNNLSAPFTLSVGQKLKVPNLSSAPVKTESVKTATSSSTNNQTQTKTQASSQTTAKPKQKISSDPTKKLPKITARSSSKFSWPVRGKIISNYGAKSGGLFNDGINIGASKGTAVKAAENGVVAYAGNEVKGMGNLIIIQHSGGWMTVYAHMDNMIVKRGTKVSVGQKIGTVGATGKVDEPQLHFEIRKGTKAYNPTSYLKK